MTERDAARLKKWRDWIANLQEQTSDLLLWRKFWYELGDIIDANPDLPKSSSFYDFIATSYATTQAIGIRRIASDRSRGTVSLARLLDDIRQHPGAITRELFLIPKSHPTLGSVDTGFHLFADSSGERLDTERIVSDLGRIRTGVIQPIEQYVNEHVAHTSASPRPPDALPRFRDLNSALDLLEELVKKYYLLVTQSSMPTLVPELTDDWLDPFRVAWLPEQANQ